MTTAAKMVIGEDNRNRDLHGQHRHHTPTTHSPRTSMPRFQSGNSSFFL